VFAAGCSDPDPPAHASKNENGDWRMKSGNVSGVRIWCQVSYPTCLPYLTPYSPLFYGKIRLNDFYSKSSELNQIGMIFAKNQHGTSKHQNTRVLLV
jgi:hypothetical protein